jgi:hypothetical protein
VAPEKKYDDYFETTIKLCNLTAAYITKTELFQNREAFLLFPNKRNQMPTL